MVAMAISLLYYFTHPLIISTIMENNKPSLSGLKREDFQKEINGKATDLFFLTNENGMEVAITNYGGALVAIMVPDRDGNYATASATASSPSTASSTTWPSTTAPTTCTAAPQASTPAYGMLSKSTATASCSAISPPTTRKVSPANCP